MLDGWEGEEILNQKDFLMSAMSKILQRKKGTAAPAVNGARAAVRNAPPHGKDDLTDLVVWSVPMVNTRLLICHAPGTDGSNPMNLVNVAVRDNSRFLKKMALRARRVTERKFDLEGPLPRWRGRW
jgi:hypothetical protein